MGLVNFAKSIGADYWERRCHEAFDRLTEPQVLRYVGNRNISARRAFGNDGAQTVAAATEELSASVREELDMRRKVNAERRSTRRSAQIVVGVSVGLAVGMALFNKGYVKGYDTALGQLVLIVVVAMYGAGFFWMRKLATFKKAERLLAGPAPQARTEQQPEPVGAARGRS